MSTPHRALVTGAGGFIGRALCRHLLAEGWEVHGTARRSPPPGGVMVWPLDLRDGSAWARVFREAQPDVVFHLAATVDVSREPARYAQALEDIPAVADRVARSCLAADVRLVAAGTCEEYGDGPAPFREDQLPQPVSPYSAAKVAAWAWLGALRRTQGLRVTWVRPFLTYGPGQGGRGLIPAAIRAAIAGEAFPMSAGAQTREVNFVDDIARGVALAARPEAIGETINLGGGPELPVIEIVERIFSMAGADPALIQRGALPTRAGEAPRFYGDHEKARTLLGHRPRVTLDEGLRRTIERARAGSQSRGSILRDRVRIEEIARFVDPRGALEKLRPAAVPGEVYLVRAEPGHDRGHHYHPRMGEWFTALEGDGELLLADPETGEGLRLELAGRRVYVPAGVAHALRPRGASPWVVLAMADAGYDPDDVVPFQVPG